MKGLKIMGCIGIPWAVMCLFGSSLYHISGDNAAAIGLGMLASSYLFGFSIVAVIVIYIRERKENKEVKERLEELESKIKEEKK